MDVLMRDSSSSSSTTPRCYSQPTTPKQPCPQERRLLCKYWAEGRCRFGDRCRSLHSWHTTGGGFSMLTRLEGHKKPVSGIALPTTAAPDAKLYTGARDGTVRVWDCASGKCDRVVNFGVEVGSLIGEGSWVFVGIPHAVKAWNLGAGGGALAAGEGGFSLTGPVGQVYALAVHKDLLFAGDGSGQILVWKGSIEATPFSHVATLQAHNKAVVCLHVGVGPGGQGAALYSGSMDGTVKVWDMETLGCRQSLKAHDNAVMSLLCLGDGYLVSASLDNTLKVWALTAKDGSFELIHTHEEQHGILKLCGMLDSHGKPVLLCSCNDDCVRLYDLESFTYRATIFSRKEIRQIQPGPGGLFFTGDATGVIAVWQWQ
ncbi:hypothetical protein Tsubulata_047516 [Turnera subulata]|uniref:C3H1-type domain-containing protein n=1 Tax=Turnera subulata TaxID=218843 RepID=A0A9Q0J1C0_9ROSI|nr:hypothetical protein Tsubulata_047516 [Turnera subulata]